MDLSFISKRKYFYIRMVAIIFLVLILAFIWGNSILDGQKSSEISDTVVEIVKDEISDMSENYSDKAVEKIDLSYLVRKGAHIIEFVLLAVCLMIIFLDHYELMFCVLFLGLSTAIIDETIQLFNDRSSSIVDVWLDMLGFSIGVLLTILTVRLIKKSAASTNKSKP